MREYLVLPGFLIISLGTGPWNAGCLSITSCCRDRPTRTAACALPVAPCQPSTRPTPSEKSRVVSCAIFFFVPSCCVGACTWCKLFFQRRIYVCTGSSTAKSHLSLFRLFIGCTFVSFVIFISNKSCFFSPQPMISVKRERHHPLERKTRKLVGLIIWLPTHR